MSKSTQKGLPFAVGICTSGTYCLLLLPSLKEIFHFKGWLIDDVVGFSTISAAGDGTLTHHLYVSLASSQMETVSKMCHFKLGQYHLALLNSPRKKPTNICSKAFYLERSLENPIGLLSYGLVYQDLYLHGFEDIFGGTYIFRKLMMSSMS